jgi:hypothetical protein
MAFLTLDAYIDALRSGAAPSGRDVAGVHAFNEDIAALLKTEYTQADLRALADATADARRIDVVRKPWGTFVLAASFAEDDTAGETHYDAVWVRDSVWAYLALAADPSRADDARDVLLTQLDYMASQAARMERVIGDPSLLELPSPEGDMNAVHIRFDSGSPGYADVAEGGAPQNWTHKQNDALGLVILAAAEAYAEGRIAAGDLEGPRLEAIVRLVAYLNAVKFETMEDSGAWEELPRRNTSSVGIVTAALERLQDVIPAKAGIHSRYFAEAYAAAVRSLGLERLAGADAVADMIARGYGTVRSQLALGGESPDYLPNDPHFRKADAALLSLIYPACPKELSADGKRKILDIAVSLAGDYGIKRYERDNYQAGNFWWHDIKTDADPESHRKREEAFLEGTEAEWFFDSWYALCCLRVAAADTDEAGADLRGRAVRHLSRAFAQITGEGMYSADGKPVPAGVPPESYNHVVSRDRREIWPAPSPIAPLNWAKASLTLMLAEFMKNPKE